MDLWFFCKLRIEYRTLISGVYPLIHCIIRYKRISIISKSSQCGGVITSPQPCVQFVCRWSDACGIQYHRLSMLPISSYIHFMVLPFPMFHVIALALLSLLNGMPTLFQTLPTPTTGLVDRIESYLSYYHIFTQRLNADEYVFSRHWTIRGYQSRPICLVDASNRQYIINGLNGSAMTTSGGLVLGWESNRIAGSVHRCRDTLLHRGK